MGRVKNDDAKKISANPAIELVMPKKRKKSVQGKLMMPVMMINLYMFNFTNLSVVGQLISTAPNDQ